jgi:hypothetical protein
MFHFVWTKDAFRRYWLPSLEHTLCFFPQAAYEPDGALEISPVPDLVARVCALHGHRREALDEWEDAQPMEDINAAERWRDVVGVYVDYVSDTALFRVLEWGGMEVSGALRQLSLRSILFASIIRSTKSIDMYLHRTSRLFTSMSLRL